MAITISVCMIVKNEEKTIGRCLKCVTSWADQIIVVDTGSTDRTVEVAKRYTDEVHHFQWIQNFAVARNYAFSLAQMDYIVHLDGDDVISRDDIRKMEILKETLDPTIDVLTMPYILARDGTGNITSSVRHNRMVKRSRDFRWHGAVHEYLAVYGNIVESDISIIHKSIEHDADRNIQIYEKMRAENTPFTPRDTLYYANELCDHQRFVEATAQYEHFLTLEYTWVEDQIHACGKIADCYYALGRFDDSLVAAARSFVYDLPRPTMCCKIAFVHLHLQKYALAAFWYELAIEQKDRVDVQGFVDHAAHSWLPHLQLCVCYCYLGLYEKAKFHNEKALEYHPTHPSMLHNRTYLKSILEPNLTS
ncbi:glycosyltransferase family 2 protein [Paenibacillus sp. N1-5-1-14]|uniref:glycosyltransferase n=1 Tax=Paenibacillus radicibacter TaxID=2972488 RepID=UPI00215908AA|nr:glycosyltransferase family 2 protein [Paenibacillus radicibacter]MCR8645622.1 glycosyltransferase family 2 protein [Paenibacillus radicibacter]